MKNGYVTFVNDNPIYLKLCDILVESVINFSENPIEVFSINFDYKHSSEKVISRRIDLQTVGFETICYSKLYSSINTSFDKAVQLDADFIITKQMDKLFDLIDDDLKLPLCSLHNEDPNNQKNIMDILGVNNKSQYYVHGTYLFSKQTKDFLKECYDFSQYCLKNQILPENFDETILNVMLWKNKTTNSWVYPYDIWYDVFINPENNGYPESYDLKYYSSHGCKDPEFANQIFNKIKNDEFKHLK
jgi:hypothetical protein